MIACDAGVSHTLQTGVMMSQAVWMAPGRGGSLLTRARCKQPQALNILDSSEMPLR